MDLIFNEQLPVIRDTLVASQLALVRHKRHSEKDDKQITEVTDLLDLSKKKVKILEEELEKALQSSQTYEKDLENSKVKFNKLVDLIKDIWQEEV